MTNYKTKAPRTLAGTTEHKFHQKAYTTMNHGKSDVNIITREIKNNIIALSYFQRELTGHIGNPTGSDWHLWEGLCPFHNDRTPGSLCINIKTGAFKCFSCGASGRDIIDMHMRLHRLSFIQAIKDLEANSCN